MSRKFLFCFIFTLFLCVTASAAGSESGNYIVYLNNKKASPKAPSKQFEVVDEKTLAEYLEEDIVEFYEPDLEVPLSEDISLAGTGGWNMDAINIQKALELGCYGNDIKVAVIDSGVYAHPDLSGNLLAGYNYIDNNTDTDDDIGHGTFVSGIIAAEANGEYIDGVAHHSKIIPLKCFSGSGTTRISMISNAVYAAVDVYGADVINMSFGVGLAGTSKTFSNAVRYATRNGCIVVAAVGNDGNSKYYYPASYDSVIGVGSVGSKLSRSYFSQYNSSVDVVAPGEGLSSVTIPEFSHNSGTSFAAPHVAAMAAIAKCIDKGITADEFYMLLARTSTDLGDEGYDVNYGWGLVNVEAMIDKMLEDTAVFMSPVDGNGENLTVTVYNNTYKKLNAVVTAAEYDNNRIESLLSTNISVASKETAIITNEKGNVRFMVWNGFYGIEPLVPCRAYIYEN